MRNQTQLEKIKSRFSDPYSVDNFISIEEINHLISIFDNNENKINGYEGKIKKNTGPVTLNIDPFLDDDVIKKIFFKLKDYIGDFELNAGFFFQTDYPHIVHNDDTFELNDVYKGITIPLMLYGSYKRLPSLCFFDQCYYHGPSKFFNGDTEIPTYYNKQIYEYSDVEGVTDQDFDFNVYQNLFTHLKYKWLSGLSLQSILEWKPTSILIFDSVRLHCASDFRKLGIKSKLGISLFTRKP
jgi:hypothetical protein